MFARALDYLLDGKNLQIGWWSLSLVVFNIFKLVYIVFEQNKVTKKIIKAIKDDRIRNFDWRATKEFKDIKSDIKKIEEESESESETESDGCSMLT